jgi:glycosyltransferase involved in cell wall biosynthesis
MNVLHLSTWKQRCGLADFTANIVAGLAAHHVVSDVFPLDVRALRYSSSAEFRGQMELFTQRAREFDLVHVQHEFSLFSGSGGLSESIDHFGHVLERLKAIGTPAVVTFHTEPQFRDLLRIAGPEQSGKPAGAVSFLQWLLRKARVHREIAGLKRYWRRRVSPFFSGSSASFRGLVLTPWTRLTLIDLGAAGHNLRFWPHGIVNRSAERLKISSQQAKARLGLASDGILLSMFGFITRYKGYGLAIEALKKLPPQFHLAIVGGTHPANPSDLTLNSILESWHGHDPRRLIITGYASAETIDLVHAATDLCLAPYLPEFTSGSGSICWALTSGKPTVATNIPTFAEIQRESGCLALCTPNAPHELAWLIQKVASDEALQRQLVQNAEQFATSYSWARVTELLLDMYLELTGGTPQAREVGRAA